MDKLWVDKHRPKQLQDLDYHDELNQLLGKLAQADDFPHLLVYGPNGAGKKTRIMCFISELFKTQNIYKMKSEFREFKSKTSIQTVECRVVSSNYHIEVTPSECENGDKLIVQQLIKEIAGSKNISSNMIMNQNNNNNNNNNENENKNMKNIKIVIINEADMLSKNAQASLRRTMEKYIQRCRIIMVCENIGRVMQPLRSRCLMIRVAAPSTLQMFKVLSLTASKENFKLDQDVIEKVINNSDRNLRRAIILLQQYKLEINRKANHIENKQQWRIAISSIALELSTSQNPQTIKKLRECFYDLLVNCVPSELIIKYIVHDMMEYIEEKTQKKLLVQSAAYHECLMQQGQKDIFHLEALACKIMLIIKKIDLDELNQFI